MDDSPTQPEGFVLTKQKAAEQATEHFQIVKPLNFKTGVWKFINFFIRHKHHKQKGNSGFLDQQKLREDYGLCLLSEELGGQSNPFDRELLMENDKVEGEANPGQDAKVRSDPRKFFHKMSLEGLMKLFADLHRKKRARELAKSSPSMSEEMTNAIAFDQPCCLEKVERYIRVSPSVSLKKETTISRASSATIFETSYIKSTNMATPANSPQKIILQPTEIEEEDSDGTLNLLESVRTKLTDYLNAEESVNSLRATYNDSTHDHDLIEDDWSRKIGATLDNDSLKCDTSCDDIPSLKNNSHHSLDEMRDEISKESICSKQSLLKQDEDLELNQSFLEEAINSEIIPPLMPSEEKNLPNSVESDPKLDVLLTKSIEEASTSKSYSYHDENLEEKRLIQYQLLHVMPFTDQAKNPLKYDPNDDNNLPKLLSCQDLNVAPNLEECSLVEINPNRSKDDAEQSQEHTMKEQVLGVYSDSTINLIQKCDRGVDTFDKNVQLCTTGVGSREVLHKDPTEPKPNLNLDVFGEDLIILEDVTPPLEASKDKKFEVVAVQRGSQDIMDEEEPYLISDTVDSFAEDDFNRISREEDLVYVTENDDITKVEDTKKTKLLFVCKYVDDVTDDNEAKTYDNSKEIDESLSQKCLDKDEEKSQVSVATASQTKEVIILEKDQVPPPQNDRSELEAMIREEIVSNLQFALDNKHLTMVTAEDQIRTSQEILDVIGSNPMVDQVKHTPTEESFMNNIHLSDSITSDLLSNLDLIILARKDDVGNTGSDSGIYVGKDDSGITTLTYRESQTLGQAVKTEGESTHEAEVRDNENEKQCAEIRNDEKSVEERNVHDEVNEENIIPREEIKILPEENSQELTDTVESQEINVDVQINPELKENKVTPEKELEIIIKENSQEGIKVQKNNAPIATVTASKDEENCFEIANDKESVEESSLHNEVKDEENSQERVEIQENNIPIKAQEDEEGCDEIRNEKENEECGIHDEVKDIKVTPEEKEENLTRENSQERADVQENNVPIDTIRAQKDEEKYDEIRNELESGIDDDVKNDNVTSEEKVEILAKENSQERIEAQENNVLIDTAKTEEDEEVVEIKNEEIKEDIVTPEGEIEVIVKENNTQMYVVKTEEDEKEYVQIRNEEESIEESNILDEVKKDITHEEEIEILVKGNRQECMEVQKDHIQVNVELKNEENSIEEKSIHDVVTPEEVEILVKEISQERIEVQKNNVKQEEVKKDRVTVEMEILTKENSQELIQMQESEDQIDSIDAEDSSADVEQEPESKERIDIIGKKSSQERIEIQKSNSPLSLEISNEEESVEENSIHDKAGEVFIIENYQKLIQIQNNVQVYTVEAQENNVDAQENNVQIDTIDVQGKSGDQVEDENQSTKNGSVDSETIELEQSTGDTIEGAKTLASDKPELAYAQAEEDIKTMIKELLYETEDLKETIIASATQSQHSSVDVCRGVLEDMINNISKEKLLVDAELGKAEDKEPNETFREVAIILEAIVDKVCRAIDTKVHKNVISVNYCLVNNHYHETSAKKLESKVVRANKNFRAFYKIKGSYCCGQTGPRVTVVNLSPTSQRFLCNEEKLTNRIRRSAALLMALYEEMRDYSYYSCTSNILCDLYESMSRNERYLDLQRNPKNLETTPDNFVADGNGNIFINNDAKTQNGLMTDPGNKEEISDNPKSIKNNLDTIGQAPNTSSNNGESYPMVASSYNKYLAMSASNSSIYSDSDEDMPSSEILPNLKYTYYSQEEINTDEEMKQIENNIEINTGRDLGLNVPLTDPASTDSIRAEVVINDSENFVKTEDDLQI